MKNSEQFIENLQRCRKLRDNRENFEKQRNSVIQEVRRLTERVGTRKGEISIAESNLSTTLAAIKENSASVVSFGVNALRRNPGGMIADATTVAIGLSNAGPRQKENIRNLRRKLAAEEDLLRLKREEQADVETQIDNTARLMIANNCSM